MRYPKTGRLRNFLAYICSGIIKLGHPMPSKLQLFPHRCKEFKYGRKTHLSHEEVTSMPIDEAGIWRVQMILGALLWIGLAVDKIMMVVLSAIGYQQSTATEDKNKAIHQLLDYCATYPYDGIIYWYSDMVSAIIWLNTFLSSLNS